MDPDSDYSIRRQCRPAGIPGSGFYCKPVPEKEENLLLMRLIGEQYMRHPEFGCPRMTDRLRDEGYEVNRRRAARLMRRMGIRAVTPGPHTGRPVPGHRIYPYLLRNVEIGRVNQVWSTDITCIPMRHGFMYLAAVIEWYSRFVPARKLSNSPDSLFCAEALKQALTQGTPEIFNSGQGSQFTSDAFTGVLIGRKIAISMDGRGRALDNVFIERLWWTLKYEEIYPKAYDSGHALHPGLENRFEYCNHERKHSAPGKRSPGGVFSKGTAEL